MNDKLVERLRKIPLYEGHGEPSSLPEDAADALEAQQARIVGLENLAEGWQKITLHHTGHENPSMALRHLTDRIRALEEALRPFGDIADLLDSETEGVADEDDIQLLLHDYLLDRFTVYLFRRAKQVLDGFRAGAGWPTGTRVRKKSGSWWEGRVVGRYSTEQTPNGYCVQLERPHGPVQIYPASALEVADDR